MDFGLHEHYCAATLLGMRALFPYTSHVPELFVSEEIVLSSDGAQGAEEAYEPIVLTCVLHGARLGPAIERKAT